MAGNGPDIALRDCGPGDIAAITGIYGRHVREGTGSFEITPPDEAAMTERRATAAAAGLPFVVAERDGAVVGFAYAQQHKVRAAYAYTVDSSVYVAEDARRAGIGRRLMEAVIDGCGAVGKRQMIAVVGDSANVASLALHKRVGFTEVGRLSNVGYKHGRWLNIVMMQRPLGPGAGAPPR